VIKISEDFDDWYNGMQEIRDKGILPVKNGLEYQVALTLSKKPEFKKQKSEKFQSLRKKYEVTGVYLIDVQKIDTKEINEVIKEDPTQELKYEQIYQLQPDTTYMLKLTEQQYKGMVNFMYNNKIQLNDPFFFRRFGKALKTYIRFYPNSQIKKQSKLPVKPKPKPKTAEKKK